MEHSSGPATAPEAPAAVLFSPDGYSLSGPRLMGRQSAGAGFLRAFVRACAGRRASAVLLSPSHGVAAGQAFAEAGHAGPLDLLQMDGLERVAGPGCLYVPMPGLSELAWRRTALGERSFSLCGVTHTIASHAVMSALADLPTGPARPWDAVICTSRAVRDSVSVLLEERVEYLRWRLGAQRFELPQLPVIPLGVHTDDFRLEPTEREGARAALGVAPQDRVVLFAGRLSFHAKAHPHPMLVALERCLPVMPAGARLHLVQCGWHANDHIRNAFAEAQQVLAPGVVHHILDGRDPRQRRGAWAVADLFVSLSDNVQETFGLTPVEAMAAGLAVVASDWDGYRDTVRHGIDGFLVPTVLPPPGDGEDLALRYDAGLDSYDVYCGLACALTAVDVEAVEAAFRKLLEDPALARRMGEAGRQRATQTFDWSVVMTRYLDLWQRLAELRRHTDDFHGPNPLKCSPDRLDPFRLFAGYASRTLTPEARLRLRERPDRVRFESVRNLAVHRYAVAVLPDWPLVETLLEALEASPGLTVSEVLAPLSIGARPDARRALVWLMKVGWVGLDPATQPARTTVPGGGSVSGHDQ